MFCYLKRKFSVKHRLFIKGVESHFDLTFKLDLRWATAGDECIKLKGLLLLFLLFFFLEDVWFFLANESIVIVVTKLQLK